MYRTVMQYALSAGIGCLLALDAMTGGPRAPRPGAQAASRVAQYCVLPEQEPNSHRLYCRNEGG
jgi:hypothetical protein